MLIITIQIPGDIMLKFVFDIFLTLFNKFCNATTFYTKKKILKKPAESSAFFSKVVGHFRHALSKTVNCPLVDIGENFYAFMKKRTTPLKLWS